MMSAPNLKALLLAFLVAVLGAMPALAAPLTPVTFRTDWKAQAEHGGFYQAVALGLYEKRGLKVTIRAGGPQSDNSRLLAAGAVDIAMLSNSFQVLNLAAKGADVKAVMAAFQKDPQVLMVHPGTGVKSLADLKGRPIYVADAAIGSYWLWLKARYRFADAQMRKYNYSLLPWLKDKRAAQEGYLTSEPFTAAKAGVKPEVFLLADGGFNGYGAIVAATGKTIRERPEVVRAFVAATREGWTSYLTGDPAPANRLIRRDNPEMTDALIAFSRQQMMANGIALSGDAKAMGIGAMTDARWAGFHQEMAGLGLFPKSLDPRRAYTLAFLK